MASRMAKVPIRLTGTAISRDQRRPQRAEEQEDHDDDEDEGLEQRLDHLLRSCRPRRWWCRRATCACSPSGKRVDSSSSVFCMAVGDRHRIGAGREVDADRSPPAGRSAGSRCPWLCAPSSTRATSRTRSSEPSGLARMMMLPNCSGVTRRPMRLDVDLELLGRRGSAGRRCGRPRPACSALWIAATMSCRRQVQAGQPVDLEPDRAWSSSCAPNRFTWPTPGTRAMRSIMLIVA